MANVSVPKLKQEQNLSPKVLKASMDMLQMCIVMCGYATLTLFPA